MLRWENLSKLLVSLIKSFQFVCYLFLSIWNGVIIYNRTNCDWIKPTFDAFGWVDPNLFKAKCEFSYHLSGHFGHKQRWSRGLAMDIDVLLLLICSLMWIYFSERMPPVKVVFTSYRLTSKYNRGVMLGNWAFSKQHNALWSKIKSTFFIKNP